ncbi:MAG: Ig-like domain-containing protein, partial [Pseudomonadota bacterium]
MRQALTAGCAITLYYYCFILTIFLSSLLATQGPAHAQAGPPFTCSGDIYQVQSGQLRIFDPTTSTYTNVGPNNGSYNATGYNILDNYAYASQGGNIIRISSNGVIENVFNIGFGSFSGDVDFSNNYWLRRNNSRYARINLSTGAFTNVDFSGPGGGPADVAYAQSGGTEYLIGFSGSGGGTLYRYNLTTATKENISLPGLPGGGFGAAWTDSTGRLFTFNNGNGQLYEVFDYFTGSPSFTQVGIGDPSGNNDGFSCALAPFPNLAPLAFDDEFTETVNNSVAGNVLPDNGNGADNDPEGLPLTVNTTPITGPANGSVALSADGSFTYTPNLNFVGVDTFVYQIIDASGLTATATVTITITGTIDFTLTKTQISGPNPVAAAGDVIGYEIVLNNIGDIPLSNVVVTDVLPDGSSASLGSRVESGGVGPFAAGRLDLGETWTYTLSYTVTQADIDGGGPLVNSASATTDETGATPRSDTASTAVSSTPSFTVDKAASAATLSAPGTVSYTITVANTGNVTLTNPDFTDDLTQGAAALSLSSGPTLSGDTDGDGDLDTGETWVYAATFDVTQAIIDDGTDLINTAIFNTDQTGPLVDTATTTFTQNPGIDVSKTVDTGTIAAPGTLTYEITAVNTGNVTLTGVALTDTLAQGATGLTLTTGPLLSSGDTDTDGNIDVGETWTYSATFDVTQDELDDGADIVNTASFTTAEGATDSDSA